MASLHTRFIRVGYFTFVLSIESAVLTCLIFAGPAKKAGHDFASNEKPQALRGETERNLQEEKAKFEAHERMLQMAATNGTAPNAELK